jgi:hypothetical protein
MSKRLARTRVVQSAEVGLIASFLFWMVFGKWEGCLFGEERESIVSRIAGRRRRHMSVGSRQALRMTPQFSMPTRETAP